MQVPRRTPRSLSLGSLDLSPMRKLYRYNTSAGPFYVSEHKGRFHPVFREESLGSYATAQQAVEDLAGGHTFSISGGIDPSSLGIPDQLEDWEKITPEA